MGNSSKIISYILYALVSICVVIMVAFYAGFINEAIIIGWAYVLLAITGLASLIFPIILLVQDPKEAKGVLIAVVGLAVVFGLAYGLSTVALPEAFVEKYGVDDTTSKMVGMGIIGTYILMGLSGGGIVFFGIRGFVKSA